MRFAAPFSLPLLWLIPVLLALYYYAFVRKRQALAMFVDLALAPRLLPGYSRRRQWLKALCCLGAVGCLGLALMQPQWGIRWEDVPSQGHHLMILLDVSRSMLAEDVVPNRLQRAKAYIRDLVQVIRKDGGHRLGLMVFASRAVLHCPLTVDYAFFLQRLNEVESDMVTPGGTAIGTAILQALRSLEIAHQASTDIIMLTDGEDHHSPPLEAIHAAAIQQVSLYTIGIGDPHTGARIPLQNTAGRRSYLLHQGEEVRSRLQESLLQEIAHRTSGIYMPAGTGAFAIERLYKEHIASKARRHIDLTAGEYLIHRYHWFVLAALLLLAVDMLLGEQET